MITRRGILGLLGIGAGAAVAGRAIGRNEQGAGRDVELTSSVPKLPAGAKQLSPALTLQGQGWDVPPAGNGPAFVTVYFGDTPNCVPVWLD
jgi:hypothetical protein